MPSSIRFCFGSLVCDFYRGKQDKKPKKYRVWSLEKPWVKNWGSDKFRGTVWIGLVVLDSSGGQIR